MNGWHKLYIAYIAYVLFVYSHSSCDDYFHSSGYMKCEITHVKIVIRTILAGASAFIVYWGIDEILRRYGDI